jgi:secreted Zn-dependent insulinase-like peptidase
VKHTWVVALVLGVWSFTCVAGTPTQDAKKEQAIFPFPVHRTQLENGLVVISVEYDSPGIVAYYTVVRTGSRNEVEPGLSGFAHFFEHMMFRGTPRFSEGKYNDALKGLGADSNAFTTDDWTCYHITASAAALETIVDVEADRFQNLKYSEADFQKEARAVLGEYNKSASSPLMLLDEKMQDAAYTTHTYKHTTIGFLKDIVDMPNQYQYSLKFFDRWYRPENWSNSRRSTTAAGSADRPRSKSQPSRRRRKRRRPTSSGRARRCRISTSATTRPASTRRAATSRRSTSWPKPRSPTPARSIASSYLRNGKSKSCRPARSFAAIRRSLGS